MDKIPGNKLSFYEFCFEWIQISGTFEKSVLEKKPMEPLQKQSD